MAQCGAIGQRRLCTVAVYIILWFVFFRGLSTKLNVCSRNAISIIQIMHVSSSQHARFAACMPRTCIFSQFKNEMWINFIAHRIPERSPLCAHTPRREQKRTMQWQMSIITRFFLPKINQQRAHTIWCGVLWRYVGNSFFSLFFSICVHENAVRRVLFEMIYRRI